jgi:hypothetical protein
MANFYNNLSPTTRLLIQSLIAVLGSVLAAVVVAVYQSYSQSGVLNPQALLNVALVTFALLFGKAMHDWVPAHAQQLIQAGKDNEAALYDALQRQQAISSQAIAQKPTVPAAPQVIVQPSSSLSSSDIAAISQQLALQLANMATPSASPVVEPPSVPVAPAVPAFDPNAYVDPLRNSAVLPAYKPPVAIPDMATQSVSVPQVPFPAQLANSPAMP